MYGEIIVKAKKKRKKEVGYRHDGVGGGVQRQRGKETQRKGVHYFHWKKTKKKEEQEKWERGKQGKDASYKVSNR